MMVSKDSYIEKRALIFFLLVAFIVRLYMSFFTGLPNIHRDSSDYFKQGEAILAGDYINYFPNGYPLIIAIVKFITGSFAEKALIWLNILLSVATIRCVYDISKQVFKNNRLALFTLLLLAIYPTQVNLVRWLTSEVSATFFLVAAYSLLYKKHYWLSGIAFGMATFIRTEMLLIALLLIALDIIMNRKFNLALVAGTFLPLLIVASWCYSETGKFSISGHGRVNIMYAVHASGSDIDWGFIEKHPEIKTDGQAIEMYFDHVKNEPVQFMKERAANFFELWGVPSSADGTRGLLSRILIAASNIFLVVFGIVAFWKNRKHFNAAILILPFVVVTGIHTFLLALQRYTFPVEPFMLVLACWMLFYIREKRLENRSVIS